jgi:hypothetical protein
MSGKSFGRAVRKLHIMQIFYKRFEDEELSEMTATQVAKSLGLEPSFHIRGLLSELVRDKKLSCRHVVDNRAKNLNVGRGANAPKSDGGMYYFKLSETERAECEEKIRKVTVKVNGKNAGQLRLL